MAFDQTIHEALQRLTVSLQQEFDTRLKAAAADLARSVEEQRQAAEAESMSTLASRLGAAQAEADRRVAEETARVRAEAEQRFEEEASRLRGELESIRRERDELQHAVTAAREASEQVAAATRQEADEAVAAARQQAELAAADLNDVRTRLATAERALDELKQSAAAAGPDADRTLAELDEVQGRLPNNQQVPADVGGGAAARVEERQDKLASLDRLAASIRRVDSVTSLSEVLNVLAESVEAEAPRAAILVAGPDGFRPFRLWGFTGISPRTLTREEAADLNRGLPFAWLPADHVGFSVPIEVGGQTVAVVYADDCTGREEPVPASWPEAVEVLARHAALRLAMVTAVKTVQALKAVPRQAGSTPVSTVGRAAAAAPASSTEDDQSARRYARLLVSEIKLYNEATVRLGRMNRDLFDRLRPEIERARKLYEERVPAHVPARATYFDDELVQTLADGDPALLGARR